MRIQKTRDQEPGIERKHGEDILGIGGIDGINICGIERKHGGGKFWSQSILTGG